MKLVLIEWTDCHCEDMWTVEEDAVNLEPILVKSVGFLLKETDTKVVLSAMFTERDTLSMVQCIPRGSIVTMKELQEVGDWTYRDCLNTNDSKPTA